MKQSSIQDAAATGLLEAFNLVQALVSGSDHPIYDHAQGIRSLKAATHAPSTHEWWRRVIAVGLYRALVANNNGTRSAHEKVEKIFSAVGLKVARSTLVDWDKKFVESNDVAPDAMAGELITRAKDDQLPLDEIALRRFLIAATLTPIIGA